MMKVGIVYALSGNPLDSLFVNGQLLLEERERSLLGGAHINVTWRTTLQIRNRNISGFAFESNADVEILRSVLIFRCQLNNIHAATLIKALDIPDRSHIFLLDTTWPYDELFVDEHDLSNYYNLIHRDLYITRAFIDSYQAENGVTHFSNAHLQDQMLNHIMDLMLLSDDENTTDEEDQNEDVQNVQVHQNQQGNQLFQQIQFDQVWEQDWEDEADIAMTEQEVEQILETPEVLPSNDCPICLSAFIAPRQLPCNHVFCHQCIVQAAVMSGTCPLCRYQLI